MRIPMFLLMALTQACALSNHETVVADLPATRVSSVDDLVTTSGPIRLESVVSARWQVPLSGLLDLDHPTAIAAGLEDRATPIVIAVHVLEHPTRGLYVIDTGITRDRMNGGRDGTRTAVEYWARDIEPVEPLLDIVARKQQPLAGVFLTHVHVDHILGIPDVPADAPIYTGPGELSASHVLHMFLRTTYDTILEGRAPLREFDFANAPTVGDFRGVIDLFGDGSLWAIAVPGHTEGSTAYLANTVDGPVLFVGDTSHTRWGWDHGVPPGSYTADGERNSESLQALRTFVQAHPEVRVVVGHELDDPKTVDEPSDRDLSMAEAVDVETHPQTR